MTVAQTKLLLTILKQLLYISIFTHPQSSYEYICIYVASEQLIDVDLLDPCNNLKERNISKEVRIHIHCFMEEGDDIYFIDEEPTFQ